MHIHIGNYIIDTNRQNLGVGGQGSVVSGKNVLTGELVAIKIINLLNEQNRKAFESEYQVFCAKNKSNKLQNVVDVCEILQKDNLGYIVMKKYDCDLFTLAFEENENSLLPEIIIKQLFRKICIGVKSLHKLGIAHLDIKPENILLERKTLEPYICDFGNAFTSVSSRRKRSNSNIIPALGYRGTRRYSPPEMDSSSFAYDPFRADIYSLGVTLYVLLLGSYPLKKNGILDMQGLDTLLSSNCIDLLKSLLEMDPHERHSVDQILNHPYLKQKTNLFTKVSKLRLSF